MAEEGKGLALAILGIVAVIAIVGLVLLFTSARTTGKVVAGPNVGDWGRMSTVANTDYTPTDQQGYETYYRDAYPPRVRAEDASSAESEDREFQSEVLPRIQGKK